jgi:hypothetical protein
MPRPRGTADGGDTTEPALHVTGEALRLLVGPGVSIFHWA